MHVLYSYACFIQNSKEPTGIVVNENVQNQFETNLMESQMIPLVSLGV